MMKRPRTACAIFYILFTSVLFLSSDARRQRTYTTGIADIVRTAFKRGLNRFISRQTAYDSDVFRYTQASQRGYGGLFAGESCRLSPVICSYDEQCCSGRCLCRRWMKDYYDNDSPNYLFYFPMPQVFDFASRPYCTNNLRRHFEPLSTTNERHLWKKHYQHQMNLRLQLINHHRLLYSAYHRQSSRFRHQLDIDRHTLDNYGFSILRSNPNMIIINEKRFARALSSVDQHQQSLRNIDQHQTTTHSEAKEMITSTSNIDSPIKKADTILIQLKTCATLIATGHGRAKGVSSLQYIDTEQVKYETADEDISLSKAYKKASNRMLLRRQVKTAFGHIYSFGTSDIISSNEF